MVTGELVGLPAELRKVAKTTEEIDLERAKLHLHNLDRIEKGQITRAQDRDEMEAFRKIAWLPAGLAAKEMKSIREETANEIYKKLMQGWGQLKKDYEEHECDGMDRDDVSFTKKSFEFAFGRCRCKECVKKVEEVFG